MYEHSFQCCRWERYEHEHMLVCVLIVLYTLIIFHLSVAIAK